MKEVELTTTRPTLTILDAEHIKTIHQASLDILAHHGVRVLDDETRMMLGREGASMTMNG